MLPFVLCACLVIQVALAIKLYLLNPNRKLNIYLALIPTKFIFSTILEINIYYATDAVIANKLYHIFHYFAFLPLIFSTLAYVEYIKIYTKANSKWLLKAIKISVIAVNSFLTIIAVVFGTNAHIYLTTPNKWAFDNKSMGAIFLLNTLSTIFWLMVIVALLVYLMLNARSVKKKWWFRFLILIQLIIILGVVFIILSHYKNNISDVNLMVAIPATLSMFFQLWVLSGFKIFDVNPQHIYEHVLAVTNNWIIIFNDEGMISYVNDIVITESESSMYQIINSNIDDFMEVIYKGRVLVSAVRKPIETNYFEIQIRFKKNHKKFSLQASLKMNTMPDKTEAFIWILIDTTKLEALTIQKQIIEATSAQLSKAYNDTMFIMNITSHDLKSPLKTIAELTEMIKQEIQLPMPNRSGEYLGYIDAITSQSITLTTQIIDYMRIGVVEKNREWLNVVAVLDHLKQRLVTVITKSAATIVYNGIEKIFCDRGQIKELLANFLDNSIKYQTGAAPIIEITITESDKMYYFAIRDNGIGIHQDFIPKLFSKYNREEKVFASGTGIGLSLCKHIVESNYGEITVSNNTPENGITILFTIAKQDNPIQAISIPVNRQKQFNPMLGKFVH